MHLVFSLIYLFLASLNGLLVDDAVTRLDLIATSSPVSRSNVLGAYIPSRDVTYLIGGEVSNTGTLATDYTNLVYREKKKSLKIK